MDIPIRSKLLLLAAALLSALLVLAPQARAAAVGPGTAAVKAANDSIRAALKKMVAARGTPEWPKARTQAREAVGQLLDFDTFAKNTMSAHWDALTPAERTRYTAALRGAIEANYLTKMQGNKVAVDDVKVEYLGEEPRGADTLVHTRVAYGTDGAKFDFVMEPGAKKKLRAIDVITEGDVSLTESYREQIATAWPKKQLAGICESFEKKAGRLEKDLEATQGGAPTAAAAPPAP